MIKIVFGAETILLKQNKVIRSFHQHQALTEDTALSYQALHISNHRTLTNLLKVDVIVEVNQTYYLSESKWHDFRRSVRRFFLI
ncbi:hypothetical protein [Staphylococcus caeli]|uniref:hypothetical protein n=1 Tax=Staphylococcus caeli TaxID=2201815 RepID=UPI003F54C5CE